jgi:ABC-type arginine/histidine transport system permease subunit
MKGLLGGCLQAVGILIAGLTGLCTLMGLASINSWRSFVAAIGSTVFFGIPFLIGVGLILAGRAMIRSGREERY